jgi:hypothetical protein
MIFMLNVHPSRMPDLVTPDPLRLTPSRAITPYIDGFGNKCVRVLAPPGELRIACDTIVADSGRPDRVDLAAEQHAVADLPHDALVYLLGSRYCETDLMMGDQHHLRADVAEIVRGDHARGRRRRLCVGRGAAARLQRLITFSARSAVIPGRADRREPGIHIHRRWLWIPGSLAIARAPE